MKLILSTLLFLLLLSFNSSAAQTPNGWDYNLTRRCTRTYDPTVTENYYADTSQCQKGKNAKQWTLVVESEQTANASCPGPLNQSFLINGANSPVTLGWQKHQSNLGVNWTVNMKVDHITHPHPCGTGYFTFFGFMDHVDHHGGPLPNPFNLSTSHAIFYDHYVPLGDNSARLVVGIQGWWGGKAHILEINLASENWGDAHPDPRAILVASNWSPDVEFVILHGPALGIVVNPGINSTISINWSALFNLAIANGWFSPTNGLPSVTQAAYIGVEAKGASVANLWHTDFRITSP